MFQKPIVYLGKACTIMCDGKCDKAWGVHSRPWGDFEKTVVIPDNELGIAPEDPGTYEGSDGKPVNASSSDDMNRWCARECERCVVQDLDQVVSLPVF